MLPTTSNAVVGVVVFIPTLPLPLTNNALEEAGEPTCNKLLLEAPEICNIAEGKDVVENAPGLIPTSLGVLKRSKYIKLVLCTKLDDEAYTAYRGK
jgi:hypothetical protein